MKCSHRHPVLCALSIPAVLLSQACGRVAHGRGPADIRLRSAFWLKTALILACLLLPALSLPVQAQNLLPLRLAGPGLPLTPYLDYMLDDSGDLSVEEVASSGMAQNFSPLRMDALPLDSGVVWLRFLLPPVPEGERAPTLLLDMGSSIPGQPLLYEPEINPLSGSLEWRESKPEQRNVLLLPEAGKEGMVCYIRLDGLPGLWFAPVLRTPHDAATSVDNMARTAAILALGVVMLLCLLRSFSESGQWRVWTALYVAAALAQGWLGMPAFGQGYIELAELPAVLTPGLALMLLPHVGRHLMRTAAHSRILDIQLVLLSLPGAALALLPLVPGYVWVSRFLDIWSLGTVLFIPTALAACIMGLGGSMRFLLGCIIPPLFVAGGIIGQELGFSSALLASAPLWGTALSALLMAASRAPSDPADAQTDAHETKKHATAEDLPHTEDGAISLDHPLDDPNLRLLPPDSASAGLTTPQGQSASLDLAPASSPSAPDADGFDLQQVMREIHDAAVPAAEAAGIGLAWYMAPELNTSYKGDAAALRSSLAALLDSAVQATPHGAVHLSVRQVPESADKGHLLFTVRDTGSMPPQGRSAAVLPAVWELAGSHEGFLGVESSPQGTTVAFSLHLTCTDSSADGSTNSNAEKHGAGTAMGTDLHPAVIIVTDTPEEGQSLQDMLAEECDSDGTACRILLAEHLDQALVLQQNHAAVLLIASGKAASPDVGRAIRHFHEGAKAAGLPLSKALAITADNSQWDLLAEADFTDALLQPVDPVALRQTVRGILNELRAMDTAPATPAKRGGQPPLDGLLHMDAGETAPLKDRDLTSLPDLLSFDETLPEALRRNTPEQTTEQAAQQATASQEAATEAEGGILLPLLDDMPLETAGPEAESTAQVPAEAQGEVPAEAMANETAHNETDHETGNETGNVAGNDTGHSLSAASEALTSAPAETEAPAPEAQAPQEEACATPEAALPADEPAMEAPDGADAHAGPAAAEEAAPAQESHSMEAGKTASETTASETTAFGAKTTEPAAPSPEEYFSSFLDGARPVADGQDHENELSRDDQSPEESPLEEPTVDEPSGEAGPSREPEPSQADQPREAEHPFYADIIDIKEPQALEPDSVATAADAPAAAEATAGTEAPAPAADLSEAATALDPAEQPEAATSASGPASQDNRQAPDRQAQNKSAPRAAVPFVPTGYKELGYTSDGSVGEPVPVGSPMPSMNLVPEQASRLEFTERNTLVSVPAEKEQLSGHLAGSFLTGNDTWIGEPMPISKPLQSLSSPLPQPRQPVGGFGLQEPVSTSLPDINSTAGTAHTAQHDPKPAPAPEEEAAPQEAHTSIMDFIAGAEPVKQELPPLLSFVGEAGGGENEDIRPESPVDRPDPEALAQEVQPAPIAQAAAEDMTIIHLVERLDKAMDDARQAFKARRSIMVAEAARRIARESEAFGLRVLARMARCVEGAANACDMNALEDLLPELDSAVERNRIQLRQK